MVTKKPATASKKSASTSTGKSIGLATTTVHPSTTAVSPVDGKMAAANDKPEVTTTSGPAVSPAQAKVALNQAQSLTPEAKAAYEKQAATTTPANGKAQPEAAKKAAAESKPKVEYADKLRSKKDITAALKRGGSIFNDNGLYLCNDPQ